MRTYLFILVLALGAKPALADHKHVTVHVKGMVCDFCSTGLTKIFTEQPSVSKVDVSLEKKTVQIGLKDNAADLPDEKIKELVTNAGYNVEKISRDY